MTQPTRASLLATRHISVPIERPPADVYAFVADVANLPRWASGLANMIDVRFVERNPFGVLDHDVVLGSGNTVRNPMRVVPNGGGSELIFTLLIPPDMSPEQLARDAATIQEDLLALKRLLEQQEAGGFVDHGALHEHHGIDYIELTVADLAAATRFYAAAFGWRFNDYGPSYAGIQGNGREIGGLRADKDVARGGPLVVLYSRDLDGTLEAVRNAGGRVVKEPYDFPGGRRFHFSDPSGNELAVWTSRAASH